MSVGVWPQPGANWTDIIFGDSEYKRNGGGPGGGIILGGGGPVPGGGKHCIDLHERRIPHGIHYVPGPDECTLCACDDGEPKWCKAVLCSPPQDCKSFRVGNSCCEFICLDDSLGGNGKARPPKTGGPYLSGPVEVANFNFVPKVVIAAVTAMLSLSLLFFLIHRLRQRHIQAGRLNSARARRSTQTCDECDDTRSLDFSNDFFEHRMNSPHLYPPQYLAWWKPPSSYFPPRGEAPPPYEEAMMATTSIGGGNINSCLSNVITTTSMNNNNLQNNNHPSPAVLNHIPIIVPPSVLPPGPLGVRAGLDPTRSSPAAIQRLASAIANTTNSGGSTTCTTSFPSGMLGSASSTRPPTSSQIQSMDRIDGSPVQHLRSSSSRNSPRGSSKPKSSSKGGNKNRAKERRSEGSGGDPQPGPSQSSIETDPPPTEMSLLPFRIGPPQHGPAPPTYEDAIYSLNPDPRSAYYLQSQPHPLHSHRHSLTLPPKRFADGIGVGGVVESSHHHHMYPRVVVRGVSSNGVSDSLGGSSGQGPLTVYTEEELLRRPHHQNQRLSLQFHVSGGLDGSSLPGVGTHGHGRGDWSSSSSTLSLSTTPNSPVGGGRAPSLSSSSESSVSENPPPPPAPSSNHNNTPRA